MDGQPIAADSKHNYPARPAQLWARSTSSPAVPRLSSYIPVTAEPSPAPYPPTHFDLVPILLPQQSVLYHDRLLAYNKLVAPGRGGGLQTPPLLPLLSPHSVYVGPRSRSSSKVSSNRDSRVRQTSQNCHGNRGNQNHSKADRALITGKDVSAPKMPPKKSEINHPLPPRPKPSTSPSNMPPHSSSVPSTPHQRARKFSFGSRDQSPNANQSHSPRSVYSEANGAVPSLRPLPPRHGPCKYETGLKYSRRRIPYSIGSDPLEKTDLSTVKSKLSEDEERKLTTDMRELYDRLQPTEKVEAKRHKLVQKLEKLLNDTWPGHDIQVHLFGSSGNLLCSDDSDVDICITTPWKELEGVCMLAELLAKHGMQKVVCVSSAKVPIVKIWDPELELSCDMNVNNTLALENTRMIKTYVEIDERVRPLAMIVKHWTRQRIINDAAFGGTLSSYTWICMIIAFLQLRKPPIVPALHQRPHQKLPKKDGSLPEFADDINRLRGFGSKNRSTLGELLFQFFRFYAHEFDYSQYVLSIRSGDLKTKKDKNWHFSLNNQLCVEEPFNTNRNLGNTADDTAFRGVHLELRRAFDLIAQGKLDECCERYEFPKEEEKIFQKPPQVARPVLLRSASQHHNHRGGRGGNFRNGNRQHGQHRNAVNNSHNNHGGNNRRASSSVTYDNNANAMYLPAGYALMGHDPAMYMNASPEALAQQLSALQLQENSLRFLQYTHSQAFAQQQAIQQAQRMQGTPPQTQSSGERARTSSFGETPPLSAPLRPENQIYYWQMPMQQAQAFYAQQGYPTYPSSPSNNQTAEYRRSSHRSTEGNDANPTLSGSTLRSHSQPASRPVTGIPAAQSFGATGQLPNALAGIPARYVNGVPMPTGVPSFMPDEATDNEFDGTPAHSPPGRGRMSGYRTNPSSPPRGMNGPMHPIVPAFGDIGAQGSGPGVSPSRGRLSDQIPQAVLDRIKQKSRSPSPLGQSRLASLGKTASLASASVPGAQSREIAPLVVNGSVGKPTTVTPPRQHRSIEQPGTDYQTFDNPLHISQGPEQLTPTDATLIEASTPQKSVAAMPDRPVIVNGSNTHAPGQHGSGAAPKLQQNSQPDVAKITSVPSTTMNGHGAQQKPQQLPHPLLPEFDLAAENGFPTKDVQLSPVYEAHSPSPSLSRKLEAPSHTNGIQMDSSARKVVASTKLEPRNGQPNPSTHISPTKHEGAKQAHPKSNGSAKEHGHARGAKSESDHGGNFGSWQKIPRGKKKANDAKSRSELYPQSEQLPKKESERKGG
ncbi:hypothetical protein F4780DRAFT_771948 [Xylariomycetidae sp. FL0641]|nr:hypothetical protein F4780DRAFT_771948 [Xylariomycetidae sp. FL0641]